MKKIEAMYTKQIKMNNPAPNNLMYNRSLSLPDKGGESDDGFNIKSNVNNIKYGNNTKVGKLKENFLIESLKTTPNQKRGEMSLFIPINVYIEKIYMQIAKVISITGKLKSHLSLFKISDIKNPIKI